MRFRFAVPILVLPILQACDTYEVIETYVHRARIGAPVSLPPLHLTDPKPVGGQTHLSPYVSVAGQRRISTPNRAPYMGTFPADAPASDPMFIQRDLPSVQGGLNVDWVRSPGRSWIGGIDISAMDGHVRLGGHFGAGLYYSGGEAALRIDLGLRYSASTYDVSTVQTATTSSPDGETLSRVTYFRDRGTEHHLRPFISMTLNTRTDRRVGGFIQGSVTSVTTGFTPHQVVAGNGAYELRPLSFSTPWRSVATGLSLRVNEAMSLQFGARFSQLTEQGEADPGTIVTPMVSMSWKRF